MAFDFLVPVKDKVLAFSELLPPQALGKNIDAPPERRFLGFSSDERYALTLSADGTASVWDLSGREILRMIENAIREQVTDLGILPDDLIDLDE